MAELTSEAQDELIVLDSMYISGDELIRESPTRFKLKITPYESNHAQQIMWVSFEWPPNYPDIVPIINVDLPENSFLSRAGKQKISNALTEQAESMLGMPMTAALAEYLKQSWDELLTDDALASTGNLWESLSDSNKTAPSKPAETSYTTNRPERKQQLSKAAKRKLTQIDFSTGEKPRGWNWVDVIAHLSKTGGSS